MYREDKTFAILFTLCLSLFSVPLMGQVGGSMLASEPIHLSVSIGSVEHVLD
tara:strand:- start:183 stop:338 length:156 start_codon:yes stop_codon:yes gene_type:complete